MLIKVLSRNNKKRSKYGPKLRSVLISLFSLFLLLFVVVTSIKFGIKLHKTNETGEIRGLLYNIENNAFGIIKNFITGKLSKPEHLYIDIKHIDYQKIVYYRENALERGAILEEFKKDGIPARITHKNETYKVSFSMMGQNLDHITNPRKWSLRVRVKGNTIFGMKKFSLVVPNARTSFFHNPINEWICHQLDKEEGLITLRYDFVDVTINGKYVGVYAIEEHFEKRLIENNKLREGILFKPGLNNIKVYQPKKIMTNPLLKSQLVLLRTLWKSFLINDIPANKLFDINKLAKYYAIADLVNGHHTHWLGNTQYYFNPVTRLIEPIGREWSSPYHDKFSLYIENPQYDPVYHKKIFRDSIFVEKYISSLNRISQKDYLDNFFNKIKDELLKKVNILNKDYPAYSVSIKYLYENQQLIKNKLYPPKPIIATYYNNISENILNLSIINFQDLPIMLIDVIDNDTIIKPLKPALLYSNKKVNNEKYYNCKFVLPQDYKNDSLISSDVRIRYKILGINEVREDVILPWGKNEVSQYCNFPLKNEVYFSRMDFIETNEADKYIHIKPGSWDIAYNIIIPKGYEVICTAGVKINLLNGSNILSYSPVHFLGEENKPIKIYSSNATGQGIVVLNAKEKSIFKHVIFERLSNPSQNGWELSGAITFYKSPVEFRDCVFKNNKKGDDFLNIIKSDFLITSCSFENTLYDAFDADFCKGFIDNSVFINSGNDCIDISGSNVEINNILLKGFGDKGLSIGEHSEAIVNKVIIKNGEIGIASKDLSKISINDVEITNCKIGFAVYQKKSEYGPGFIEVLKIDLDNVSMPFLVEERSTLIVDNKSIHANR